MARSNIVLMQEGIPAITMDMEEGAQIICVSLNLSLRPSLSPGTVPTMVVLKVPCMNDTAASHPLQKNDLSS